MSSDPKSTVSVVNAVNGSHSARQPAPPWLDERALDFGAPQGVVDALLVRLGVQPMARLIADRAALREAILEEARRQAAVLRLRLLFEEWGAAA